MKPSVTAIAEHLYKLCEIEYGFGELTIKSKSRKSPLPGIRSAIMACAIKYGRHEPLEKISALVNRHHAMVCHLNNNMEAWLFNKRDEFTVAYGLFCAEIERSIDALQLESVDAKIEYHRAQIKLLEIEKLKQIQHETRTENKFGESPYFGKQAV